jgi:hypothetical protein
MNRRSLLILIALLMTTASLVSAQAVPVTPVIVSPADGSTTDTHAPLLQWTGDPATTTSFKVTIKDAAGVKVYTKGGIDPAAACTGTDCSYSFGAENVSLPNGQFTWKVVAKNEAGKSKSDPATFTVEFPGIPELIAPADNATTGQTNPTFEWNVVNQADQYRVKVKNTVTGEKFNSDWQTGICAATCTYTFANNFALGTYKWSVDARQVTFPDNVSKSVKRTLTITAQ